MGQVFIDEKGPQETIRIPNTYRDDRRINLGDDLMRSYVADVLYIPEDSLENVNKNTWNWLKTIEADKK